MLSGAILELLLGVAAMLALMGLQVPIGISMALVGIVGITLLIGFGPAMSVIAVETVSVVSNKDVATVPLFILMGELAAASRVSGDIYRAANAFVGHRRGGLAMSTVLGSAGFGAICGSSMATTATMARVALPEMERRGYSMELGAGSIASGGGLGILIPPSIVMVIYAALTQQFVIELFAAAVIPGIVAVLLFFAAIWITVRLKPDLAPAGERSPWGVRGREFVRLWRAALIVGFVTVGIYAGIFTVIEAASMGVAITSVFWVLSSGRSWKGLSELLVSVVSTTGMILVMLIGASILGNFVALTQATPEVVVAISEMGLPPLVVLLTLLVMYIFLGSIFDSMAALILTLPFVFPLVTSLGYDPIWWGVINVIIVEIALITPPVGLNVFILHGMAKHIPLSTIFRGIVPFLLANIILIALMIAVPSMALYLPSLMR
jgi:tripartite ATP-independent transporter DctM subunit